MSCPLLDKMDLSCGTEYGAEGGVADREFLPLFRRLEANLDRLDRKQTQQLLLLGVASFLLDTLTDPEP